MPKTVEKPLKPKKDENPRAEKPVGPPFLAGELKSKWRKAFTRKPVLWGLLVFLVLGPLALSLGIKWGLNAFVLPKINPPMVLDRFWFNPLTGSISLSLEGTQRLKLDGLHVEWDWVPLIKRTVRINALTIKKVTHLSTIQKEGKEMVLSLKELALRPSGPGQFTYSLAGDNRIRFDGNVDINEAVIKYAKGDLAGLSIIFNGVIQTNKAEMVADKTAAVKLESIQLKENGSLRLHGEGFRSPLNFILTPLTFSLVNLDFGKPNEKSDIQFKTQANEKSQIQLSMAGFPLQSLPTWDGEAVIKNLDLPPLSALAERFIGHQIEAGKLNAETKIKIDKGLMDSKLDLELNRLEMDGLNKKEIDPLSEKLGVPVGPALMILKDKNGDIKLSIPVKNDSSDPDIGLGSIYKKVIAKGATIAVKSAIGTAFPPFKVAGWIKSGVDFATKLRFDDLQFQKGKTNLTKEAQSYLDYVGKLMVKKPKVRIKITGVGTAADLGLKAETPLNELSEKRRKRVLTLAEKRATQAKAYLTKTYQVNDERLFMASPEFDPKLDAKPRTEISL